MKKWFVLLLIVVMMAAVVACGSSDGNDASGRNGNANAADEVNEIVGSNDLEEGGEDGAKTTQYPLVVTDATGTEVTFDKAPERIVSNSPSETEILYALGLGDKIAGVSNFCDYPLEATLKPKVGGVSAPNEEAIIAAEPDLVIGGVSMKDDVAEKLRQYELKLYKSETKNMEQVFAHILQIGIITDTQVNAEQLIAKMQNDIRYVTDAVADIKEEERKKIYIEFNPGWTVGKGEFMDELISLAGAKNIAADTVGWVKIDEEKIIQDNPDVILYTADMVDKQSGKTLDELIKSRSGWDKIKAVQDGHLVAIDESLVSRTGPRITEGLLQIAKGVYPELMQ